MCLSHELSLFLGYDGLSTEIQGFPGRLKGYLMGFQPTSLTGQCLAHFSVNSFVIAFLEASIPIGPYGHIALPICTQMPIIFQHSQFKFKDVDNMFWSLEEANYTYH